MKEHKDNRTQAFRNLNHGLYGDGIRPIKEEKKLGLDYQQGVNDKISQLANLKATLEEAIACEKKMRFEEEKNTGEIEHNHAYANLLTEEQEFVESKAKVFTKTLKKKR